MTNLEYPVGVAVDLGSTTIAVSCWNMTKNRKIVDFSFPNPQSKYGLDVITRIKHCLYDTNNLHKLRDSVLNELKKQLKYRMKDEYDNLKELVITGNPTMIHILRGLSVDGFAKSPFQPISLSFAVEKAFWNIEQIYPPGISAFVGSDLLVGTQFLNMGNLNQFDLLIDLGTNGELLLLNKDVGYATSTACGTVFDTAIAGAKYGSDSLKAIANCLKNNLISSEGKIVDFYFDKGIQIDKNFIIHQNNVRDFQLAKGAVHAGILCLMKKANIDFDDIHQVYVSGGFGFYMDQKDAFVVKLLPDSFLGKIICAGNSSLDGAVRYLTHSHLRSEILVEYESIRKRTTGFDLASFNEFQNIFIESLNF